MITYCVFKKTLSCTAFYGLHCVNRCQENITYGVQINTPKKNRLAASRLEIRPWVIPPQVYEPVYATGYQDYGDGDLGGDLCRITITFKGSVTLLQPTSNSVELCRNYEYVHVCPIFEM